MSTTFEYPVITAKELELVKEKKSKRKVITREAVIAGVKCKISKRFLKSLQMRFRFSTNIFKYFDPTEVMERISKVSPNDRIRCCIAKVDGNEPQALAVTNPNNAVIPFGNLCEILDKYDTVKSDYANGVVRSLHNVKFTSPFNIAGDTFLPQFSLDTPIDGFGKPTIYLSMLREVCTNGMVGYAPVFRSELNVGKKGDSIEFSMIRALEGFNNEEGFGALRERVEAATQSWGSVAEAYKLQNLILKIYNSGDIKGVKKLVLGGAGSDGASLTERDDAIMDHPVVKGLFKVTGDLNKIYGMANLDTLSMKKQRTLPSAAKVYDLFNFASEVGTHHATPAGNRVLQAYIGSMLADEFDLEGTVTKHQDWKDFFIMEGNVTSIMAELGTAINN